MEKKQLNFNAPLLSVRKSTSTLGASDGLNKKMVKRSLPSRQQSLPLNKSDWEPSEVTKPAAVPFLWEQIPGRPKGDGADHSQTPKHSSSTPRLPPGRVTDSSRPNSGERPIYQNTYKSQFDVYPTNDHAALLESLRESLYTKGESDQESVDDGYSDAFGTHSPEESLSLNCSLSGLSGFEVPNTKPSGTFSVDTQTRDFMISRFLPAAKAVVLDAPQYIPRKSAEQPKQVSTLKKQPIMAEQPKQIKKVASNENKPLLDYTRSNLILSHYQYTEDVKSEGEEEDDEHDNRGKQSRKAWGFFPRLCVKKSLCLLNPVPAMKTRTPTPKSPANDVSRLTRKAYSGPLDKPAWDPSKKKFHSGVLSREILRIESKMSESNQLSYSSASYKAGGLSPCRPSRSGGISPYRNATPQSPFSNGARFLGMPKEVEHLTAQKYNSNDKSTNSQDAPASHVHEKHPVSVNSVAEKSLHIDSVNNVNHSRDFASSEVAKPVKSPRENLDTLAESRKKEENSIAKSRIKELTFQDTIKRGNRTDAKSSTLHDAAVPSSACTSKLRGVAVRMEGTKLDQGISQEIRSIEANNEAEAQTDPNAATLQSPLPLPLPKSPSESWLWRTVPSVHLQNPFSHSHQGNHFQAKKPGKKASTTGTKWETMVKTSNLRHDHGRYSEELIPHISHIQKKK